MEKINNKKRIQMQDFVIKGDEMWFAVNDCNKLFHYDLKKKELWPAGRFPGEVLNKQNLFSAVEEYKDRLFFIPFMSDKAHVYDMQEDKFETIELNIDEKVVCKYCSCFRERNFLYLLPICCKSILKINLDNFEQENMWAMEQFLNMRKEEPVNLFFRNDACKCGDRFVSFLSETKMLTVFEPGRKKVWKKGLKFNNIISICNEGNNIFCLERSTGNIICWNMDSDRITYMEINYENIAGENLDEIVNIRYQGFVHSAFKNNSIYICPDLGNISIRIDLETKSAYTVIETTENSEKKHLNSKMHVIDGKLSFFYGAESALITIDEEGKIEKERILLTEEALNSIKKEILEEVVMEEDPGICDLTFLVEGCSKQEKQREIKMIGKKIFTEIKEGC